MRDVLVIFLLMLLTSTIPLTDGISCYSCANTSSKDGKDDCQVKLKTMSNARVEYEETGVINPWVKNCSANHNYCVIETSESRGRVFLYIRDCSDGKTFNAPLDEMPSLHQLVRADNQTSCGLYNGYSKCISLCSGDFCNGPSKSNCLPSNIILLLSNILFYFILK